MKIGIKFCGGCNPVYDRGRRVSRFREAHPEHEYVTSDTNAVCDIWMVVCGCSRRCADTNGLKAGRGIVLLWDEDSFKRLEEEAAEAAREGEAGGSDRRVLHLHEKARRSRMMTSEDVRSFAALTGDKSRLHLDSHTASRAGFERPLVHGMFLDSLVSAVMGTDLPGSGTLYTEHTARFIRPVYIGDTIEITVEFVSFEEREDCYIGMFRGTCRNQNGERVLSAMCSQMMKKSLFKVVAEESEQTDYDEFREI